MLIQESALLFDLSTLRENALLDTKQEAVVRAIISSTEDLIAGLDAKIRDTENAPAELHKQRDAALETMIIPTALVAHVCRLPPEVLGEIFHQCVPIEPTHLTPFDSRDAPLLLTRICHRWRQVAQGTPLLWTKLVLYGRTSEAYFSPMWLNNSGSLPLDISVEKYLHGVCLQQRFGPVGDSIDSEYTARVDVPDQSSQMVVEQFPRIRKLSLLCEARELRDFFPREAMTTLPSLQKLCVRSMFSWDVDQTDHSFRDISTPRLQTLVLKSGAEFLLPALECTSNLRILDIRGKCTLEMFVDFVSRCPALQRIDSSGMDVQHPRESMDMSHIVLPNLSHLGLGVSQFVGELDSEDWSNRTKSLGRLRTPNLQSMEIWILPHCGRILSNCMADSLSRLNTLTIRDTQLVTTTLGAATSIFASIEKVEFIDCGADVAGFWESLTDADDTPSHMCTIPKLKSLLLEAVYMALEHEAGFLQFVERRAPPMRSQGQLSLEEICYLEEIELSQCRFSMKTLKALERLREDRKGFSITMKGEPFAKHKAIAS